ncbi:hypothetical protein BV22DRAFT_1169660 [Leucogyrophana mollusca]|uniref:Uncharacterized protein n=1 Tax=Leucogyrophana mollusca TaxID=85980 RepID=A0ACB8BDS3_9AGAM|nr:hypothetical protein BV22DRAFT_1169660 [Leucogyrophana mollusca]
MTRSEPSHGNDISHQAPPSAMEPDLSTAEYDKELVKLINFTEAFSAAILVYDYILTFDLEVTYVWGRPWSIVNALYLFTKYTPFVGTTFTILYRDFLSGQSGTTCFVAIVFSSCLGAISAFVIAIIHLIRAWAIWGRGRCLAILIFVPGGIIFAFVIYIPFKQVRFLAAHRYFGLEVDSSCPFMSEGKSTVLEWALFVGFEILHIIVMVIHGYPIRPFARWLVHMALSISQTKCQTVIGSSMTLSVVSAINLGVLARGTGVFPMSYLTTSPARVLMAIFTTRIILHLRETNSQSAGEDGFTQSMPIVFAPINVRD